MDILIIMDIIGMAREVQKKNLDLRDTEEVRMPYLHQDLHPEMHYQVPHLDQMPHLKQHLKPMLMPQLGIMHITDTIHIIHMDILIITDIIGMAKEVQKNLKNRDTEEGRMPHPHQMPHQMPHLKLMLMPQLGITHITDTIHIIHMDITTPITGTDEDKKNWKKFSNGNFFSLSQQRQQ